MGRLERPIRMGVIGLGWIGQEITRAALEDVRVQLVGVADIDRNKSNRDLGEIIGEGRLGLKIDANLDDMLSRSCPEVVAVATMSDVEALAPVLECCLAHGTHVVTTCENLADPESALAQLRAGFGERVRERGLVVLATGINPGFAMDRLPVLLAQATRHVRRVRVVRVVNASTQRAQLQTKIGAGMTVRAFNDAMQCGQIGLSGLSSSVRLVARGLGLALDKTSEAFTPVMAERTLHSTTLGSIERGLVRGTNQIARGYRGRRELITLELTLALDEPRPRDTIDIVGEPPLHFEGELPGDLCTVATVLSAISLVRSMDPGLRTVLDLPLQERVPIAAFAPQVLQRPRAKTTIIKKKTPHAEIRSASKRPSKKAAKRRTKSKPDAIVRVRRK